MHHIQAGSACLLCPLSTRMGRFVWKQRATQRLSPNRLLSLSHPPAPAKVPVSARLEFGNLPPLHSRGSRAVRGQGPCGVGASKGPAQLSGLFPKSPGDIHPVEASEEPHEPQLQPRSCFSGTAHVASSSHGAGASLSRQPHPLNGPLWLRVPKPGLQGRSTRILQAHNKLVTAVQPQPHR